MALSVGIVGLPNVGKSTTFNALTKAANAEAANYPFCTIEPNKAIVTVPDPRLDQLCAIVKPKATLPSTIEFVDIAGLVKGASQGEGLGNKFLSHIRDVSAIVHVVRCFEDENIVRDTPVSPRSDVEIIETELILADYQQLERKIERLAKQVRGDKKMQPQMDAAQALLNHLGTGAPAASFPGRDDEHFLVLDQEMRFLTAKPVIFAANVDENTLAEENQYVQELRTLAAERRAEVVKLSAKIEEEMIGMSDAERTEMLSALGAEESGLDQIIKKGYSALGLQSYFTAGPKEVRSWTIPVGAKAPQAAGVIHSDFERGFIRAEVVSFGDFIACGGESGARAVGKLRTEGKEYVVQDGDVMHFLFNV